MGYAESNLSYVMPHSVLLVNPVPPTESVLKEYARVHFDEMASIFPTLRDVREAQAFKKAYACPEGTVNLLWKSVADQKKVTDDIILSVPVPHFHEVMGPGRVKAVRHALWLEARSWGYKDESVVFGSIPA